MHGVRHALDAAVDRAACHPLYTVAYVVTDVVVAVLLWLLGRRLTR